MKASAVNELIERADAPVLTFGDLVALVSEVTQRDAPALLSALFESGRARFVDPRALDRLATLSSALPATHGVSPLHTSCVN